MGNTSGLPVSVPVQDGSFEAAGRSGVAPETIVVPQQRVPYSLASMDRRPTGANSAASESSRGVPNDPSPRREDGGIVTVLTGGEAAPAFVGGANVDPELAALHALPVFAPILRGSIVGNTIIGRLRNEGVRGMDPTALLMMARDLQEHLKLAGATAAQRQVDIGDAIRDTERIASVVLAALVAHSQEIRALVERLSGVDAAARDVEALRQRAMYTQGVLQRLDIALRTVETEIETSGPSLSLIPPETPDEDAPQQIQQQ